MQARDCISRPQEGTDSRKDVLAHPGGNLGVEWRNGQFVSLPTVRTCRTMSHPIAPFIDGYHDG